MIKPTTKTFFYKYATDHTYTFLYVLIYMNFSGVMRIYGILYIHFAVGVYLHALLWVITIFN